jgi:hypothetical protein
MNIDLIVKGGALVLGLVIVIMLGIWLFSSRSSGNKPTNNSTAASSSDSIWVRPQPGESILPLVATSQVSVTVTTQKDGITLFQGTIPRGDRRDIPRRGALKVVSEPFQNLSVEIGGQLWPMQARESIIRAP